MGTIMVFFDFHHFALIFIEFYPIPVAEDVHMILNLFVVLKYQSITLIKNTFLYQ